MEENSNTPDHTPATELTITIKNEEANYKKKFLIYDLYTFTDSDPLIKDCIDQTIKEFNQEHTDITLRAVLHL